MVWSCVVSHLVAVLDRDELDVVPPNLGKTADISC